MGRVLLLRSCRSDMTSRGGFQWPESGPVECPDWNDRPECGGGLHGLLLGQQDPGVWYDDGKAIAFEAEPEDVIDLGGKAKARRGVVVYCGDMAGASAYFAANGGAEGLHRRIVIGGDRSTLTGGNGSILTGGDWSTLTGGYWSTLTGGNGSTLTGGYRSTLTGGDGSTLAFFWWDGRRRLVVGYVGENGITPNTPHRLNAAGEITEAR